MAVAGTGTLVHLPFADRESYGDPYPEGIAVGHIDVTGDASGGGISAALQANGGFLYRLELLNATFNAVTAQGTDYLTAHRWATDRSGLGAAAFDLNWIAAGLAANGFSVFVPSTRDLAMIKRFPIGRTDDVDLQIISSFNFQNNVDTAIYDIDWMFTYWAQESLYRPGFLASFWESPFVPNAP